MFAGACRQMLRRLLGRETHAPPGAAQSHLERGKALSETGRHAEATAALQHAIALAPDYAEAHHRLGLAWRDQQQLGAAIASYRRALALRPDYAEAHNNLGAVLQLQGKLSEALASYRRAVALGPDFSQPYLNLGRLHEALGDNSGAAASYRRAIANGIEPDAFRHLLSAVEGDNTARAPEAYARLVFNNFAEDFDRRLVDELGYRIPELLATLVTARFQFSGLRVLDLGCGTGLCGAQLGGTCAWLTGVDVSPAMLEKARARNIYHELIEQDLAAYLQSAAATAFDVVLAADVFIYVGDLAQIFRDTARVLKPGGVFAFSAEQAASPHDFLLTPSGRYAQSAAYLRRLAEESGFSVLEAMETTIRGAPDHAVNGLVLVLRKL